MAQRIGKCTNYASCKLAYQNADITTEAEFVCPECGQPLREIAAVAGTSGAPNKALLFGGIGAGVLILGTAGFFLFKALLHRTAPSPSTVELATPSPEPPPPITPEPVVSPTIATTPVPETPKPKPPTTPATPRPAPPTLIPATPKPADDEEMPTATAVIDRNPQSTENRSMRAEVLKRIDEIPNLKPSERSALYSHVNKAKEMMKVITIPFGIGKRTVSPAVAEKLCDATHAPQVQKLTKDPTVVFVVLGFADTVGSAESGLKLSTARAGAVADSLRDRCKILNKMQPVGMGSSEFFGAENKDKNRVVEVWAVIP